MLKLLLLAALAFATDGAARGPVDFSTAKKILAPIHAERSRTLYCGCAYRGKIVDLASCGYQARNPASPRSKRIEWEHVVPAEAFGNAFREWREGAPQCVTSKGRRYKGRKCAGTNPEFSRMEADLYNLWPEIGELNGLRSNFSMAALGGKGGEFGRCDVRLRDRKFEPSNEAKGIVARVYLYMDQAYPGRGIISEKNRPLFAAWDKLHPVTEWECRLRTKLLPIQGDNPVLADRCKQKG